MNRKVAFYNQASNGRLGFAELRDQRQIFTAVVYVNRLVVLAHTLELDDFPIKEKLPRPTLEDADTILTSLYQIEEYLTNLHSENIFDFDKKLLPSSIQLDDNWRSKVSTYIVHIHGSVEKSEMKENLREGIFTKLTALQREVDKNRTRFEAGVEVWLALTEAVAEGAKNLEPAVRLIGTVIGPMSKLKSDETEQEAPRQLPSPDALGLPELNQHDMPPVEPDIKE